VGGIVDERWSWNCRFSPLKAGVVSKEAGRARRLRGNFSGRGIWCVRSKSPHLLQSYETVRQVLCRWLRGHTNFPGLREERRHVVVSVALQLKHHRCTPSLSFLFASSVKTTSIVLILGKKGLGLFLGSPMSMYEGGAKEGSRGVSRGGGRAPWGSPVMDNLHGSWPSL
jgi:hypothetical protein